MAQNVQQKPLTQIIVELEERFDIVFTYLDSNIEGISIKPPSSVFDLSTTLDYLQNETKLKFIKLDSRFVAISIPEPLPPLKLCGLIKDESTRQPLSDALVISGKQLAISDDKGYFSLDNLSQKASVTIRLLGYETIIFTPPVLSTDSCDHYYLRQKVTTLEQVVVTNFLTRGINKRVDGSIVINSDRIGILPGLAEPDVLHSIQALPGILSINETVSDINVRGGTNDQNLILWDGIRMYQSGHFFGLISAFNPYFTSSATLIKNGTSAELGEAVSSTIDIKTDNELAEKMTGSAGFNLINADLLFKIPITEKMSLHLSGRRSFADGIQTPTFNQYFDRAFRDTELFSNSRSLDEIEVKDKFHFIDGSLKFLYNITDRDKLRISFLNIQNEINYQENELLNGLIESRKSGLEQESLATGLDYSRLWSDKLKTSLLVYVSSYRLNAVNFDSLNGQNFTQKNEILDAGFKIDSRINLNNNFELYSGYQFNEIGATNIDDLNNPDIRRTIKEVIRSHAIFAEGSFDSNTGNTNARLGVRANYFGKFNEVIIEPRFTFSHTLTDRFSIELLGEFKNQTVTQVTDFQTDFLGIEKRRWVLSNDADVPIIRSKQTSLGINYNYNDLLISVDGYLKRVEGITASSQGFQNQFQFDKTRGSYDAVGLDFLVNKKYRNVSSWLGYTIADNTFDFNAFVPPTFPNNLDIAHTITVGASYEFKSLEVSSGLNFRTGKPFTRPNENTQIVDQRINYSFPNGSRIDNYFRVDLSVKYNFKLGDKMKAQFGASVWNILNRDNIVNVYYQIDQQDQVEQVQQKSLGITPNINFRINF